MLKNAILDAKICEDFAEIWQEFWTFEAATKVVALDKDEARARRAVWAVLPSLQQEQGKNCEAAQLPSTKVEQEPLDALLRLDTTLSEARSRLDQRRFSRPNTQFSAFLESFQKNFFSQADFVKRLNFVW